MAGTTEGSKVHFSYAFLLIGNDSALLVIKYLSITLDLSLKFWNNFWGMKQSKQFQLRRREQHPL